MGGGWMTYGGLGGGSLTPLVLQVYADASLVFPLLVAETFAQRAAEFPVPAEGN